ncbi:conserved Plasmodium protein, unknown function [Plasmodium berghei]|uniref:Uncharacterized protein n=2 Tax=Plasmodium berghei TaxID=5821 RepID=A0A509AKR6_PLABA|nr:conserved Plasmodium protein, unknown function [Plasmodium berghei ANKA]SCM21437.1 conserved Plasmodium protein, unknown function [Plasmodium berghei]SCN24659.1 conserved Plasmodium protein, unknown function [Plasmodium berghei]SCO59814.1 conserved Plasmodium protein, unknown function [Plasmodium berghei]SCO61092.1 conserved Plasmodium protein, unknown function [Plasmodium berghei]VUC55418.1 conserved Plasmodium protein, unknown function [Plasmodium berghei ANKA]|eukprot:XP_034421231.1 conserved Plasmodium protein, unknown function [Plasmodium berghei ANKA]
MEEDKSKSFQIFVGIAFYLFYLFYMFTYSFEVLFIFYTQLSYMMLCAIFIFTLFSILFISYSLMYISCFFVIIMSLTEISEFTKYTQAYFLDEEFNKIFLMARLFGAINFIIFYSMHMGNLKKAKYEKQNNENIENEINQTIRSRTIPVAQNTPLPTINNNNNHHQELPRNNVNIHDTDVEKDKAIFMNPQKTEVIEGYVLKKMVIPVIHKEDIKMIPEQHNTVDAKNATPFNHYKIMTSESLNNPRNDNYKMNNPEMNHFEMSSVHPSINNNIIENNPSIPTNYILYNQSIENNRNKLTDQDIYIPYENQNLNKNRYPNDINNNFPYNNYKIFPGNTLYKQHSSRKDVYKN